MPVVFPDNTVLINFALCDEMRLLQTLVGDRGAWTASVAAECNHQAKELDLPAMGVAHEIFGKPLYPETPVEHLEIRRHQEYFRDPGDGPKKHLGESETLAVIGCRKMDAIFVTDDSKVSMRVAMDNIGVCCVTTWDLVRLAVRCGEANVDKSCEMRRVLLAHQRVHVEHVRDLTAFLCWLSP